MADGTIDTLSIEIGASSANAAAEIDKLATALKTLKTSVSGSVPKLGKWADEIRSLGDASKELSASSDGLVNTARALSRISGLRSLKIPNKLGEQIRNLGSDMKTLDGESISRLSQLAEALGRMSEAVKDNAFSGLKGVFKSLNPPAGITKATDEHGNVTIDKDADLERSIDKAKSIFNVLSSMARNVKSSVLSIIKLPFAKAASNVKAYASKLGDVVSGLKRIAFYRMIRSIIKEIGKAMQEGGQNAYFFSKNIGDSTKYISEAMDSMNSASYKLCNQLGAAWNTLYASIAPVLEAVIALLTRATTAVTQFFSVLGGKSTYMKAIDYSKDWAEETKKGAGAAKEWKNQLMGFDEINRLNDTNNGGGGGASDQGDYGKMFEEAEVDSRIQSFAERLKDLFNAKDWKGLGTLIGETVNNLIPSEETMRKLGTKFGDGLKGIVNTAFYALTPVEFDKLGERVAQFLNNALRKFDMEGNGGSGSENLGRLIVMKVTKGLDFALGLLGTLDFGRIGKSVGSLLFGAFDQATTWLDSYDWGAIARSIPEKIQGFIEGLDPDRLGESFGKWIKTGLDNLTTFLMNLDMTKIVDTVFDGIERFTEAADVGGIVKALGKAALAVFATFVPQIPLILVRRLALVSDGIVKIFEELGDDTIAGFFRGISEKLRGVETWIKDNWIDPFVKAVKGLLGIHSPSTVFADIGSDIVQGLWNGIKEKWEAFKLFFEGLWDRLKQWWNTLSLGPVHIPIPHFEWTYTEATGLLAKAMQFAGLPASIPHLNISWYAKGGIVDRPTVFGAGEAGREAIIPLERNTEWISRVATELNDQMASKRGAYDSDDADKVVGVLLDVTDQIIRAINDKDNGVYLDGEKISASISRYQRRFARAIG